MGWLTDINIREERSFSPIYHKPFEQFSPSYQLDYSWAPSVIIDSPGSSGATITTKKEATQTPYVGGSEFSPSGDISTPDYGTIAIVLGVLVVGGYLVGSWIKKKK